jgi:Flp pilus assembly protein TadG
MIRSAIFHTLTRLRPNRSGNVAVILAICLFPMMFAVGFGIDYSRAMRLQTKLNAAADAAALAAVTAPMMRKTADEARMATIAMFNGQVAGLSGLIYDSATDLTVTVSTSGVLNTGRTVVLKYRAKSSNVFSGVLSSSFLYVSGTSTADAIKAPFINFYLMLDTSPSMLLPSTSDGLNKIRAATSTSFLSNGCAYACHNQNPHNDNIYVRNSAGQDIYLDTTGAAWPVTKIQNGKIYTTINGSFVQKGTTSTGQYADGFWLTRNYSTLYGGSNIELRLDAEQTAAQDLIPFAQAIAANNNVTYKLQIFGFGLGTPTALTSSMTSVANLTTASVPNLGNLQTNYYSNNCPTASTCNSDQSTEFAKMFNSMSAAIPTPGDGSTASTPQAVMFIVTDGMSDESLNGSRNARELRASHLAQCTAIKDRGIRIAILYTEYLPESLTGDSWSQTNVAPYLPNISPALQRCASSGTDGVPLFYMVSTNDSISDALTELFSLTVQSAHLTK